MWTIIRNFIQNADRSDRANSVNYIIVTHNCYYLLNAQIISKLPLISTGKNEKGYIFVFIYLEVKAIMMLLTKAIVVPGKRVTLLKETSGAFKIHR